MSKMGTTQEGNQGRENDPFKCQNRTAKVNGATKIRRGRGAKTKDGSPLNSGQD